MAMEKMENEMSIPLPCSMLLSGAAMENIDLVATTGKHVIGDKRKVRNLRALQIVSESQIPSESSKSSKKQSARNSTHQRNVGLQQKIWSTIE